MPQSKHLIPLVTVVAIMTWAWGRGKTAQMQTEALKPRSRHAAPAWGAVTSWSIGPGYKAQLSQRVPPGPLCPQVTTNLLLLMESLTQISLECPYGQLLIARGGSSKLVFSAKEPSLRHSRKDRETTGLWQTPSLPDPPESLFHPLHFPPLLTLHIAPSPEWGWKEKPM